MSDFKFRHGTFDASIFNHVYEQNEYEIASLKGKRVLDIGGHIGSFALKAIFETWIMWFLLSQTKKTTICFFRT